MKKVIKKFFPVTIILLSLIVFVFFSFLSDGKIVFGSASEYSVGPVNWLCTSDTVAYSMCGGSCGGDVTQYISNKSCNSWINYGSLGMCLAGYDVYMRSCVADFSAVGYTNSGSRCTADNNYALCQFYGGTCTVYSSSNVSFYEYNCIPQSDSGSSSVLSISLSPSTRSVIKGNTTTYNITINNTYSGTMALSVSGCPSGATCSLSTTTLGFISDSSDDLNTSTILTVNTGSANVGTYTVGVSGTINGNTASGNTQLVLSDSSLPSSGCDSTGYICLNISPTSRTITQGNTTTYTISGSVGPSMYGAHLILTPDYTCPQNATCILGDLGWSYWMHDYTSGGTQTFSQILTVKNTSNTPASIYDIKIRGNLSYIDYYYDCDGVGDDNDCFNTINSTKTVGASLTVNAPTPAVSLSATPITIPYNTASSLSWSYSNASSCTMSPALTSTFAYPSGSGSASTGNLTTSKTYTLVCNGVSSSATVNVESPTYYNLNVIKSGQGSITSNPAGIISCGVGCSSQSAVVQEGASITLTATPASGRIFTGWSGACSGTSSTCTVVVDSSKTTYANFIVDPNYKEF